jgi:hypothetical protein
MAAAESLQAQAVGRLDRLERPDDGRADRQAGPCWPSRSRNVMKPWVGS